jgi:ribosomal protein S18 acetylase RimI-like enzyme
MTEDQYAAYLRTAAAEYAEQITDSGAMPAADALVKAEADFARLLPDGLATPGQHLWTAYDGDQEVGMLWLAVTDRSDGRHAFGYDFSVREDLRRRGHGRAMIEAAERICREMGVVSLGLNVFAQNTGARALYERMGFEVTSLQMAKRL